MENTSGVWVLTVQCFAYLPFLTMIGKAFVVLECCCLRAQISLSITGFCFHLFIIVQSEKIKHGQTIKKILVSSFLIHVFITLNTRKENLRKLENACNIK